VEGVGKYKQVYQGRSKKDDGERRTRLKERRKKNLLEGMNLCTRLSYTSRKNNLRSL